MYDIVIENGLLFDGFGSKGVSLTLNPDTLDATCNDDRANWCNASSEIVTGGDLGTPGSANDSCVVPLGDVVNGENIVTATCMGCHASNPAIVNSVYLSDEELTNLFANGQGYMPAQNLTTQEKLDVITYLRQEYSQ